MTIFWHALENNQEDRANGQQRNFTGGGSELERRKAKLIGERKGKGKERQKAARDREPEGIKLFTLGIRKMILSIRLFLSAAKTV